MKCVDQLCPREPSQICIFWHLTTYVPPLGCTFYVVNLAFLWLNPNIICEFVCFWKNCRLERTIYDFVSPLCTTKKKLFKDFQRQHFQFQTDHSLFMLKQIWNLPTVCIFDSFRTIFEKIETSKHPRSPSKQPPKPATTFLFLSDSLLLLSSLWDQVTDWVWVLHTTQSCAPFFPSLKTLKIDKCEHWMHIYLYVLICTYINNWSNVLSNSRDWLILDLLMFVTNPFLCSMF